MGEDLSKLVTTVELSGALGVMPETVRRWAREGLIPSLRLPGGRLVFDSQAVLEALRDRQHAKMGRRRPGAD